MNKKFATLLNPIPIYHGGIKLYHSSFFGATSNKQKRKRKESNKKTTSMEHKLDDDQIDQPSNMKRRDSTSEKGVVAATTTTTTPTTTTTATKAATIKTPPSTTIIASIPVNDTTTISKTKTTKMIQNKEGFDEAVDKMDLNVSQQDQIQKTSPKDSTQQDNQVDSEKRKELVLSLADTAVNPGMRAKEEIFEQALRLADTVANPYVHVQEETKKKQEQSTHVTAAMCDPGMQAIEETLLNSLNSMELVKSRQKALRLADALTNPYIHAQEETQTKQEKSTLVTDMSNPGMRAQEERLANIIDTMDSVKRRQQARRRLDAMANPYMYAPEETKTKEEKSTFMAALSDLGLPVIEETLLNSVDSMELVKRNQQARKLEAIANPDLDAEEEIQSEQSDEIIFPGAVHVGSRLSDMSIFSAIRQGEGRISLLLRGGPQDDDMISEHSELGSCISANLVSEAKKRTTKIFLAEPIRKRLSRKTLICVISVIILVAGNSALGIIYSRKNREESTDPIVTKSDEDEDGNTSINSDSNNSRLYSGPVLQAVKDRGFIRCKPDETELNQNEGFTLDLCRAIAAAIFDDAVDGNTDRIQFIDLPFGEQFTALWDGSIDVSTAITTHNMVRDVYEPSTGLGIAFSTPFFYSGMRFVGRPTFVDCAERGDSLIGACRSLSVCVKAGTTQSTTIEKLLPGATVHEGVENVNLFDMLVGGTCDVIGGDILNLKEQQVRDMGYEGEYSIGSKLHTNEPLAIASKGDDQEWADFCNWILQALITAEALDISQETALSSSLWSEATKGGNFPEFTSVFGDEHKNMFRNAIAAVGSYGELYDKYYEPIAPRGTATVNTINFGESGLLFSFPFGNLLIDESTLLTNIPPPRPILNGTLESIESVGVLRCGIIGNRPGFALLESNKEAVEKRTWNGLDIEYCRAIAAALFSHSLNDDVDQDSFIAFVDVGSDEADGYVALDDDRIDIFVGGSISLSTDIKEDMTGKGFTFSPPYFYYDTDDMIPNYNTYEKIGLSLVTSETDTQWSAFVRWISIALIYAEANDIKQEDALEMPVVELFGSQYLQMFREATLAVGNYGEMFNRTLEFPYNISRSGRNWINANGEPQFVPIPFI